jgi:hypothetical protein
MYWQLAIIPLTIKPQCSASGISVVLPDMHFPIDDIRAQAP